MTGQYSTGFVYPQPIPGLRIRRPPTLPPPGYVVVGYAPVQPDASKCDWDGLSMAGWLWVVMLGIFFFPLMWVPCVMDSCYEPYQVPVYNHPQYVISEPTLAQNMAYGTPVAQPYPAPRSQPPPNQPQQPAMEMPPYPPPSPAGASAPPGPSTGEAPYPPKVGGYQIRGPEAGFQHWRNLSWTGWILVVVLAILFPPLVWVPFTVPNCFSIYQVPIPTDPESALDCAALPEEIRIRLPPPHPTSMIQGEHQELPHSKGPPAGRRIIRTLPVTWQSEGSSEFQISIDVLPPTSAQRKQERRSRVQRAKARLRSHHL